MFSEQKILITKTEQHDYQKTFTVIHIIRVKGDLKIISKGAIKLCSDLKIKRHLEE